MPVETEQYTVKKGFKFNDQYVTKGSMVELTEEEAMKHAANIELAEEATPEKEEVEVAAAPSEPTDSEEVTPDPVRKEDKVEFVPETPLKDVKPEEKKPWVGGHDMSR